MAIQSVIMIKKRSRRKFSITTSVDPDYRGRNIRSTFWTLRAILISWVKLRKLLAAADAAIIVVSGKAGVEVGTQKAWDLCEKYKLPRMFFVSDMDVDDASYREGSGDI